MTSLLNRYDGIISGRHFIGFLDDFPLCTYMHVLFFVGPITRYIH